MYRVRPLSSKTPDESVASAISRSRPLPFWYWLCTYPITWLGSPRSTPGSSTAMWYDQGSLT